MSLADMLDEFADALEAGDDDTAETLATDIADEFEQLTAAETEHVQRSLAARTTADEAELPTLDDHVLSSIDVALTETSFLLAATTALADPSGPDQETIDTIRSLADAFETRQAEMVDSRDKAQDVTGGADLPASISILDATAPSSELTVSESANATVRIENVGDETASGVSVTATTGQGLTVNPTDLTIGSVPGTTETTIIFEIAASSTGEHAVTFEVASEDAGGATASIDLSVVASSGPPPLPGQESAPQDLTGDGLYRDLDGNGQFTIGDVRLFFEHRASDAVQNNPECFNFDGADPATVTIADVQALFADLLAEDTPGDVGGESPGGEMADVDPADLSPAELRRILTD